MTMQVQCPGCKKALGLPKAEPGQRIRCPLCQTVFAISTKPAQAAVPTNAVAAGTPPRRPTEMPIASKPQPFPRPQVPLPSGMPIWLVGVIGGMGLMVLLAVAAAGLWFFSSGAAPHAFEPAVGVHEDMAAPDLAIPPEPIPDPVKEDLPKANPPENPPPKNVEMPPEPPAAKTTRSLPPLPKPLPIVPAKFDGETFTRELPAVVERVTLGGGGRFLILHLPKIRQLAVFDVSEAKIVKLIPVESDNISFAAGMTKLVVANPETNTLHRFDLLTFKQEAMAKLQLSDPIRGIGLGYGSDGPLFLTYDTDMGGPPLPPDTPPEIKKQIDLGRRGGKAMLFDLLTFEKIDLPPQWKDFIGLVGPTPMRGSLDGRTMGAQQIGPGGIVFRVKANGIEMQGSPMGAVPSADGKFFFGYGVYAPQFKKADFAPEGLDIACIPAVQGPYYLAIPGGPYGPTVPEVMKHKGLDIRLIGHKEPLHALPNMNTTARKIFGSRDAPLSIDQRYHLIPDAKVLVMIPESNDRLVLHRVDLDSILETTKLAYLFVTSTPTPVAHLGDPYRYVIRGKAKHGGMTYRLDAGPEGMKLDKDGTLTWSVPRQFEASDTDVIVTLGDANGQEVFHTFRISVQDKNAAK